MGRFTLEIINGPERGRSLEVSGPIEIGRGEAAQLRVNDPKVSATHLRLTPMSEQALVEDLGSANGTFVNDERVTTSQIGPGDTLRVGSTVIMLRPATNTPDGRRPKSIVGFTDPRATVVVGAPRPADDDAAEAGQPGDLTPELVDTSTWSDAMVARAAIPIVDAPFVSIGGGHGSFVMVDFLRQAGVPTEQMRVLTVLDYPWQNYEYLTAVSQIPPTEILRSDSASTPDNIWGFPSYAFRHAFGAKSAAGFLAPFWNVLTENVLCDYWTPMSGQVFRSQQREADRIEYSATVARGQVRMVRKREGGGYFSLLTPPEGSTPTKRVAYRSSYVHIAVGYPGLRFLDDLQAYRQRHGDAHRVVNAYEPHEHVYEELVGRPGRVVVRGGGIVASRVLQRLIDDRDRHGAKTEIVHLLRNYVVGSHGPSIFMRRKGGDGWAYQGFNWPKATWGGQLKSRLNRLEGKERAQLLELMGGTNTPKRRLWQNQLARGRREGFYRIAVGQVERFEPGPRDTVLLHIKGSHSEQQTIEASFVIDATGLEADIAEHRLLADLLQHAGAGRNPLGRLDVDRTFELRGCRSGNGRMYAAGASTLGGYFAGVDTFLGLQYAALEICDDLARLGFCLRIGVVRSISQWWKWVLNRHP